MPNEDDLATARRVLDDVREVRLKLRNEELDDYFSNGCFYSYSNIPLIGWLQNWTENIQRWTEYTTMKFWQRALLLPF